MQCIKFVLLPLKVTVQIKVAAVPGSAHSFRWHASLSPAGSLRLFEFQCQARRQRWQVTRRKNEMTQNMQRTLSFASGPVFKFMSLYNHKKNLEYEVHTNMTNMQK